MQCQKIIIWFAFIIIWCDGQIVDSDQIRDNRQEKYRQSRSDGTSKSSYSLLSDTISQVSHESAVDNCNDDIACLSMASTDRLGLEAIRSLHQQLDDDANGNIDLSESDDFLREELKYDSGYEKRQRAFHRNDDMHISVRELWEAWLKSEVHNWTVEQTSEWLAINVDLPQYVPNFIQHRVTGATLPRLAVNNMFYLTNVIGIKDPIHKQKIALKAMDVVLFGPPKESQSLWKDLTLVTLLFGAIIGVWYTYLQRKKSRLHLYRMMKDMESLQRAELALEELQKELERAKLAQENVATEKQNLEKKLQEAGGDSTSLHTSYSDLEVSQLKAEIEYLSEKQNALDNFQRGAGQNSIRKPDLKGRTFAPLHTSLANKLIKKKMLRTELQIAEGELKDRCWSPPLGLQQWLQLTHEIENKSYLKKKISAEKQLQQAREACEKLRKKRTSLVGAFVSTHGKSIDDVDRSIVEARTSLTEVTVELQERVHRWKQIELLCGFNIINNNGLQFLEGVLYRNNGRPGLKGRTSSSQDDLDDETSSIYTSCAGYVDSNTWKESADSSGSEASKQDDESSGEFRNPSNNVQFTVGGETSNWGSEDHIANKDQTKDTNSTREHNQSKESIASREHTSQKPIVTVYNRPASQPPPVKTNNNNNNSVMVRSQSHDVNINADHSISLLHKQSQSETNLETHQPVITNKNVSLRQKTIKEQQPVTVDEETYSTDSTSSTVDEEVKRRRRKLFPTFNKKNKSDKFSDRNKEKNKVSD